MASFAERMGHREVRSVIQSDGLDLETRTGLWNIVHITKGIIESWTANGNGRVERGLRSAIWVRHFKAPADEEPEGYEIWRLVKKVILTDQWFDALDLIENIVRYIKEHEEVAREDLVPAMTGAFNNRFEHFLVGYRFVGVQIIPVDSAVEAGAVAAGQEDADQIAGARYSLDRAVELLADRQSPDYANSVKESISAVEAVVKKLTGEGTLGKGLTKLETAGLAIHPALKSAWSQMYGWTSDEAGIRHGGIDAADVDQALAKYLLVTCSAFVSYLIEEGRKLDLLK